MDVLSWPPLKSLPFKHLSVILLVLPDQDGANQVRNALHRLVGRTVGIDRLTASSPGNLRTGMSYCSALAHNQRLRAFGSNQVDLPMEPMGIEVTYSLYSTESTYVQTSIQDDYLSDHYASCW